MADIFDIAGRIHSTSQEGVALAANEVKDETLNMKQSELNAFINETKQAVEELSPDQTEALALATDVVNLKDDVNQGAVFDVSAKYPTSGYEGGNTYTLATALAVLNANLPASKKKGGMSIKFIQSSDNKYVQARCMAQSFTTDVTQWQGVDDEPTVGSHNLVESGGTKKYVFRGYYTSDSQLDNIKNVGVYVKYTDESSAVLEGTIIYVSKDGNDVIQTKITKDSDNGVIKRRVFSSTNNTWSEWSGLNNVLFVSQSLNDVQKQQARINIGAADESVVATMNNLLNQLTTIIGEIPTPITFGDDGGYLTLGQSLSVGDTYTYSVTSNQSYKHKKILCTAGDKFTLNINSGNVNVGTYIFCDSSNKVLAKGKNNGRYENEVITAPLTTAYLCFNTNDFTVTSYIGEAGSDNISKLETEVEALSDAIDNIESKFGFQKVLAASGTLANGAYFLGEANYTRRNASIIFSINCESPITDIDFGFGKAGTSSCKLFKVTDTVLEEYAHNDLVNPIHSWTHGINIGNNLYVVYDKYTYSGAITLISDAGTTASLNRSMFRIDIEDLKLSNGAPTYLKNNTGYTIDYNIKKVLRDVNQKIYLFGDSYMSIGDNARWPTYMLIWGYDKWFIDAFPGKNSENIYAAFLNDIELGNPDFAVWGLGMNDGSDTDINTPQASWLTCIQGFIAKCLEKGVTPILATIPTVPNIYNEGKNKWVRESGYRYIDFAEAVGAQADGTWIANTLASDNVHPSQKGGALLAHKVLMDFPEIVVKSSVEKTIRTSGMTEERPNGYDIPIGFQYFDTTLGKPIYARAIGATAPYNITWVDANGNNPDL